jgi:predicted alpha/beta superfamily hydrolase
MDQRWQDQSDPRQSLRRGQVEEHDRRHAQRPRAWSAQAYDAAPGQDGDAFSKDFLNDLVPFVQKTDPVSSQREDTAIAGFSMGGVKH